MTTLHAEWTKIRTVPGTAWLLAGIVALTVPLGALAAATMRAGGDPARSALTGVALGQAVVVVLAVAAVSGEYGTGMIRTTFTALPRRLDVLAAKGFVVSGLVLAAGAVAVAGSVLAGRALLPEGLPLDGPVVRAAAGSVLYLALIALLAVGVAAVVRDAAAATGLVLGLLYLTPIITTLVADPDWYDRMRALSPMTAGIAIQATVDVAAEPIAPWSGLGVLALWAAAALAGGALSLRLRDA
ncbi:ABC transporter permease [Actinophytocola sp. NPDC049390]|uniref:ABC transporter permease n=1 Tax=Actinophytocola sp. NPDC049390 TaxID=3363894 RepID=UPI0037A3C9EB